MIQVTDHPRVCGEKLGRLLLGGQALGITPAYAGKRAGLPSPAGGGRDHPRVCGEKPEIHHQKGW